MEILREQDERLTEGEYDFWFASEEQASDAKKELSANGFLVGGAIGQFRATVATDSISCRTNIDEARELILAMPN